MAKIFEGAIKLASTIQQTGAQPLDDRVVVAKVSDLYNSFGTAIYNGMLVAVAETGDVYMLKDKTKVGEAAGWKLIGGDTAADLTKVKKDVDANKAAIDIINGTGDGSFKKGDADTLAAAKADATTKADAVKGSDTDDAGAATVYGANKAAAAADAKAAKAQKTIDDFKGRTEGFATAAQGTLADNAVRAVTEGTANGTISVTTGAGVATDIAVHGLGSAAYTNSNAYATAAQGTKADAADTLSKANKAEIDIINGDASTTGSFAKGDANTLTTAKKYTDDSIAALDVTGNTSEAVKGVTITVDETDGKVIKPVISIANGTLTGAATDENLVTGKAVKTYVDGKVKDITDNANTLSGRVDKLDATHTTKGDGSFNTVAEEVTTGIAGIAETSKANTAGSDVVVTVTTKSGSVSSVAVDSSVLKKAVTDGDASVKSDLLGDAATDYNTLGKLEDKIQAEALRADTAEKVNAKAISDEITRAMAAEEANATAITNEISRAKAAEEKNADAAAAAKTAADKAQETADAKVKSVEGTNTVVATTTAEHAVSVSLKTSDKGNVKFTQDADGLSANVTIPPATVTGVKSGDKVLALDGTELTSTISLSVDATAGDDGKKYIRLKGIGDADLGKIDIADFVKDGMLNSAELVTNPAGQSAGTYIKLTWNTDGGKDPMYINVTSLIDIYTNGDGLTLTDHEFSVDWTKVAKKDNLDAVEGRVTTLEGKVGSAAVEGGAAATGLYKEIADEADRAMQAEAALLGKPNTDTSNSNTIYGAKKYTDASIAALDVTGNKSEAKAGIAVTVNETDGKVSKPIVEVTPGSVAADNASVVTGGAVYTAINDAKSALIGTDGDAATEDTIKGAKKAVEDLKAQIEKDAVTLTIPDDDPYITASKDATTNKYTISSKKDGTTPLVDVKINAKLTEKINSLDGGGTSPAVNGISVTVTETDGIVAPPTVTVTPGSVADGNTSVVTGGAVYTAVEAAKTTASSALAAALTWHEI